VTDADRPHGAPGTTGPDAYDAAVGVDRTRSEAFGDDAERYDRARPGYPAQLVRDLLRDRPTTVLDVGCGTGIACRCFEGEGRRLLGIEPDPRMAAVACAHGLEVEHARFEEWDPGGRRFDLLISGQAWHWVAPAAGAAKAAEALRPGGRFGVFWNRAHPDGEMTELFAAVYGRHAPQLLEAGGVMLGHPPSHDAEVIDGLRSTDAFVEIGRRTYGWSRPYTAESWLDELPTHSDHRFLEPGARDALLEDLRRTLPRLGSSFRVRYDTRLLTAVRR